MLSIDCFNVILTAENYSCPIINEGKECSYSSSLLYWDYLNEM